MNNTLKKMNRCLLAATLVTTSIVSSPIVLPTYANISQVATEANVNLALNKPVVKFSAQYASMPATNLTDADKESRWSTEAAPTQFAVVDLGKKETFNKFEMVWESDTVYAKGYKIYVADEYDAQTNTANWGNPVVNVTNNTKKVSTDVLQTAVSGRYVKLEVDAMFGYQSVSCRDFAIYNFDASLIQNPNENVALRKTAVASSIEAESVKAANATDGNSTASNSRWGSDTNGGPHWIYVDLGKKQDVRTVKVFWENRKATAYKLQVANENPGVESSWTTVYESKERPVTKNDCIELNQTQKAQYVRLYIDSFTADDPDGGVRWNSVSIYEMEVYGGVLETPQVPLEDQIEVKTPAKGANKLEVVLPKSDTHTVTYNGTDYEQIVDTDLTIYQPLVDTQVSVSFKIQNKQNKNDYKFKEINVTIPGKYTVDQNDNAAPTVLPELREWKGHTGSFTVKDGARIVIASDALKDMADLFAKDYQEITGKAIQVVKASSANAGDYFFELTSDKTKGLKKEGYLLDVADQVKVTAEHETGAYWATRTILQSLKLNNNLPKGIARDYPLYPVRGFILDVGRKTFTQDYLEQVVKQMAWYKMNDFQVHLNDNLIPLEHYNSQGADRIMQAYSGFRLESDIKAGGNGGKNKADLTSKDVFYTKDGFRNLIKQSRVMGVNIVPEIDTPAHSLALTKVRPDLRQGLSGRQNDHLDLIKQYDASLQFVQEIFNEYMTPTNPVFDQDTIVHVGADEYGGSKQAYRRFCNDMFKFVQDSGRKVRVWGSLTSMKDKGQNLEVRGDKNPENRVEINLWNAGWADMKEMYDLGFDLINSNDAHYYIVPNAGYYYDYLNDNVNYNEPINRIGNNMVPAGDKQMLGGSFAVWNDMTDYLNNGISEYDIYDRIENAIPLFGAKLWGKKSLTKDQANTLNDRLGDAPGTNFGYKVENKNGVIAEQVMNQISNATNALLKSIDGKKVLELKGKESFVPFKDVTVGLGNSLRVKVKRTSNSNAEQVLFEGEYGSIKAVQKDTGCVGFSRENYDYSFNYALPMNEWVELEFKNEHNVTKLYVNGKLVDTLGDGDEKVEGKRLLATLMFPIDRIGSKTNSFVGFVDDVHVGVDAQYQSTMELEYALIDANAVLASKYNATLRELVKRGSALAEQFNPSKEELAKVVSDLKAELNKAEVEKANYDRVNAYLSVIPKDLSVFEAKSVERLNQVVSSIRKGLARSLQATVDGYADNLALALDNLKLKPIPNTNYVDNALLKAEADCNQPDGSTPDKVLDNNPDTIWHTLWETEEGHPKHWLSLSTKDNGMLNVAGIMYLPRKDAGNGTVTKYRIEAKNAQGNYVTVKEGTLPRTTGEKFINFDRPVSTSSIRIVYLESHGNFGSAAEIKLIDASAKADIEGLNAAIAKAEQINKGQFTEESWTTFQNVIKEAKELAKRGEQADAYDVDVMIARLQQAATKLRLVPKTDFPMTDIGPSKPVEPQPQPGPQPDPQPQPEPQPQPQPQPEKPGTPLVPIQPSKPKPEVKPEDSKPNKDETGTGDVTSMGMFASMLATSGVVLSGLLKRKKRN